MSVKVNLLKERFTGLLAAISVKLNDKLDTWSPATSARRLTDPFTISLSGDATGSVSTNGSENVSMAVTVARAAVADVVARLQNARTINGSAFDGTGNITTANWGTARNFTFGDTTKSVNGSGNISFNHTEMGVPRQTTNRVAGAFYTGTTAPGSTSRLNYDGDFYAYRVYSIDDGGGFVSDRRLKTDFEPIANPIEKALAVGRQAFTHCWTEDALLLTGLEQDRKIALDAQTVQAAYPEAVDLAPFDREDDGSSKTGACYLSVKYERTIPGLFAAFAAFVDETRGEITRLTKENEELRSKIEG